MSSDVAERRAHMPAGTPMILNARSLQASPRRLAALVAPGLSVFDAGCGTGAITRGMVEAVGPGGRVVGLDVDPALIAEARRAHDGRPGLSFALADVYRPPVRDAFDIVTAARVLQWLADPGRAVRALAGAVRPGGRVGVLDFSHERIRWVPGPPVRMQRF